ncbi:hypothetical protein PF005_g8035 [Phytophthora fragariae]|uniref:Uncharacterized protein n=1 Tax=Phytophthora fragariae TaxID=53985 RepID=A0A6A3EY53_9STRA|nr:hypothetical protein PF003_g6516 [Phytophthora fragariae]KAE8937633.1 hypothetical protein PF009_g12463 [Phytophthora fragariae]KAE8994326.1 hypothetical protein PF011_g16767 [Phytophthora fragariae]KAE9090810.1 hypothetical protein PF010_g18444 [Phytophthora fragariae]KAE9090821.1 hypothetical protein PF007_g19100 [Phytophthora fragariae]
MVSKIGSSPSLACARCSAGGGSLAGLGLALVSTVRTSSRSCARRLSDLSI